MDIKEVKAIVLDLSSSSEVGVENRSFQALLPTQSFFSVVL